MNYRRFLNLAIFTTISNVNARSVRYRSQLYSEPVVYERPVDLYTPYVPVETVFVGSRQGHALYKPANEVAPRMLSQAYPSSNGGVTVSNRTVYNGEIKTMPFGVDAINKYHVPTVQNRSYYEPHNNYSYNYGRYYDVLPFYYPHHHHWNTQNNWLENISNNLSEIVHDVVFPHSQFRNNIEDIEKRIAELNYRIQDIDNAIFQLSKRQNDEDTISSNEDQVQIANLTHVKNILTSQKQKDEIALDILRRRSIKSENEYDDEKYANEDNNDSSLYEQSKVKDDDNDDITSDQYNSTKTTTNPYHKLTTTTKATTKRTTKHNSYNESHAEEKEEQ